MNEPVFDIRSVRNREELEAVYELLGKSFTVGRDYFRNRLDHDSTYDFSTTWVGLQEERITSTIQVFPLHCRIEDAAVKVGGLGSVATDTACQGQGQGRQMLKHLTGWMEQEEFDLSLLFAVINPYYEKAGWVTIAEDMYTWERESVCTVPFRSESNIQIRPFQWTDLEALSVIYDRYNTGRTSTLLRSAVYWQDRLNWPKWKASACLVAVRNGVPVAYGNISKTGEDGTAQVEELGYLEGAENAVIPLLEALLEQRPEAVRFISFLPEDFCLKEALDSWGAKKSAEGYMMWKMIRFQPLLAKLREVLQRRLLQDEDYAGSSLTLMLECEGQTAYLHYADGQLAIEPVPRPYEDYDDIILTQQEWITLLLRGYEVAGLAEQVEPVLQVLFPKQCSVFYSLDRF